MTPRGNSFRFDLGRAVGAEEARAEEGAAQGPESKRVWPGSQLSLLGEQGHAIAPEVDFGHGGNSSTMLRAFTVRVAFFKLGGLALATGALAASPGARASGGATLSLELALSSGTCAVAAVAYYQILLVRQQTPPAALRGAAEQMGAGAQGEQGAALDRIGAREAAVDALRLCDWLVTLPLLTLHAGLLTRRLTGKRMLLGSEGHVVGAALQPALVGLGAVYRLQCNELRGGGWSFVVGVLAFCAATAVFGLSTANLVDGVPLSPECPIDQSANSDAVAVNYVAFMQLGYPLVYFTAAIVLQQRYWKDNPSHYPVWLSNFKDSAFVVLDIGVKGGIAFYSLLKTEWAAEAPAAGPSNCSLAR